MKEFLTDLVQGMYQPLLKTRQEMREHREEIGPSRTKVYTAGLVAGILVEYYALFKFTSYLYSLAKSKDVNKK